MSLDTVVEEIEEEAQERAEEIRQEGEARAEEIIAAAESDADEIVEEARREAEREAERERDQQLSSAKLEAKHERMSARRDAIVDVREEVESRLRDLDGAKRRTLTQKLLRDALVDFRDDDELAVHFAPYDESLIEDLLEDYTNIHKAGEYDCLGGVVVESETSPVRVKNTFDAVLETVWDEELKTISNRLFDEE